MFIHTIPFRIFWLVMVVSAINSWATSTLQTQVADPFFSKDSVLRIEVLETGEAKEAKSGEKVQFQLPPDTLWNLCVSDGQLERCYELIYNGEDSLINVSLTDTTQIVYQEKNEEQKEKPGLLSELGIDSVNLADYEEEETVSDNITLKKVLLRLRKVPKRALGKSTVSAKLIKRAPGLAEADVMRSIQNLPGVVASSDFSSKIYVRGGGSDQNLFLFDNGIIFSPVHFFGLFSTFLVEGVDEVDFYKGGFSTEYGNRLSSVVDVKAREGGDEKEEWFHKTSVKISSFASQIHTEGHQNGLRWLLAGRVTYLKQVIDALRKFGVTDLNLDYRFWDIQSHVSYEINKNHKISMSHYGGNDRLVLTPLELEWGNQLAPFNWSAKWNKYWQSNTLVSYSLFEQTFDLENIIGFENGVELVNVKSTNIFTPTKDHTFKMGLDVKQFHIDFVQNNSVIGIRFEDPTDYTITSPFLQHEWKLNSYTLNYGLRGNYLSTLKEFSLEPRFGITQNIPKDQYIDFHLGYYKQFMNTVLFADQETINEFYYPAKETNFNKIKPSSNILFSMGYRNESIWEKYFASVEGYYKSFENLLVFAPFEVPDSVQNNGSAVLGDFFKSGAGYSLGYELSFRKDEGWLFGGVSFSQGYSVLLEENDSIAYYPKWHQPWSLKIDGAFNWKGVDGRKKSDKKGYYRRSSTQLKFANGLPYTEYIGYIPAKLKDQNEYGQGAGGPNPGFEGNLALSRGSRNNNFVKPYFRWDIKVLDIGVENKWNFSWTILNITNSTNIFLFFYDTSDNPPTKQEITQFPFFPVLLSYELYF